jgi:hypothetical protein
MKIEGKGKRELVRTFLISAITDAGGELAAHLGLDCLSRPLTEREEIFMEEVYVEAKRRIWRILPPVKEKP